MTKIGLIGFGAVGKGFYEILKKKHPELEVVKVGVKNPDKPREYDLPLTYDAEEIVNDPAVDYVIEAIDDAIVAFSLARTALENGKTYVTANKKMVAEHLPHLLKLKEQFGGQLYYEAAVCGSIPVIQLLQTFYKNENIMRLQGILNGSTNYILTRMLEDDMPYAGALKKAQEKGFAESDPTLDVDGFDAVNKLSILSHEVFKQYLHPTSIKREGISQISTDVINNVKANGDKLKLIADLHYSNGKLSASVSVLPIDKDHPLFNVDHEYNAVLIEGEFSGDQMLYGKGAGSLPTGLAVVGDLLKALNTKKSLIPAV